ncbi:hypothetical protein [Nitratidesulfovibrio sp. SRB-5]|uniref:hypothetical protein n=1 Tax=Nitratidesulfovibrio sp. SRB-5 TaxID=2872636 RepID=UPI0010260613|nr:hypothetical protein [Nitratidesulfovibrio sp. SRB-5]MBZ2172167.1 hypothetical protein [Nitratidesulfovibrio sp. SRB-5]RXF77362.1 hypothetical protein EKK70_06850 [Desulfovibrio sp. DS-1]
MNDLISTAIRNRCCLFVRCAEHECMIEPHLLGLSANGKLLLKSYQSPIPDTPFPVAGWRTYRLEDIEEIELTDIPFPGPRADYDATQPGRIAKVICQL